MLTFITYMQKAPRVSQRKNVNAFKVKDIVPKLELDKCYLHIEGYDKMYSMNLTAIPISKTLNSYGSSTLKMLEGQTGWVILPGYLSRLDDNGKKITKDDAVISDIQLAVTGKCKLNGETYPNAVKREVREELGFSIETNEIIEPDEPINGSGGLISSKIYPNILKPINITPNTDLNSDESRDDYKRRVQCWYLIDKIPTDPSVYKKILNRKRSKSTDTAGELIAIVTVEQLRQLLNVFVKQAS